MGRSAIEWTEATWNPVTGCSKVSPGCAHCYAEALTARFAGSTGWIEEHRPWAPTNAAHNVRLRPEQLEQPFRWRRPRMVFVNSMSDLFHERVPADYIARVFATMAASPQHTFQVLTKRPGRMQVLLTSDSFVLDVAGHVPPDTLLPIEWPLPNVWMGVSIENRRFVGRADVLREVPAAVRFISAEPLLGPLIAPHHLAVPPVDELGEEDPEEWEVVPFWDDQGQPGGPGELNLAGIDWLIVGGESGLDHRPIRAEWVRDLRDRAHACGTAFFMKQMGGYRPGTRLDDLPEDLRIREWPHAVATG